MIAVTQACETGNGTELLGFIPELASEGQGGFLDSEVRKRVATLLFDLARDVPQNLLEVSWLVTAANRMGLSSLASTLFGDALLPLFDQGFREPQYAVFQDPRFGHQFGSIALDVIFSYEAIASQGLLSDLT